MKSLASPTPENNLLTLPIESWKFKKAKTNIGPLLLGEKKNLVGRIILVSPMSVKTQASFHPKITGWVSVKHASWKVWTQSTDSENVTQINIFYFYCYQLILMPIWRNDSKLNPEILKVCLLNSRNESVSRKKWIPCLLLIFIHFLLCHHHSHEPGGRPTPCLGSAVGSDLPERIWFPALWLSRKWRWVLNMMKQNKREDFCDGSCPFLKENSEKPVSPHSQKIIINYAPWNATGNHPGTMRTNQFEDEASPDSDVGETRRCWPWWTRRSHRRGTSLVVQLLRLCTSNAEGVGSIPEELRSHMSRGTVKKQNRTKCF